VTTPRGGAAAAHGGGACLPRRLRRRRRRRPRRRVSTQSGPQQHGPRHSPTPGRTRESCASARRAERPERPRHLRQLRASATSDGRETATTRRPSETDQELGRARGTTSRRTRAGRSPSVGAAAAHRARPKLNADPRRELPRQPDLEGQKATRAAQPTPACGRGCVRDIRSARSRPATPAGHAASIRGGLLGVPRQMPPGLRPPPRLDRGGASGRGRAPSGRARRTGLRCTSRPPRARVGRGGRLERDQSSSPPPGPWWSSSSPSSLSFSSPSLLSLLSPCSSSSCNARRTLSVMD
jgi:hypothetical protein